MDEKFRSRLYDLVEEWTRGERDIDSAEDTERLRDLVTAMGNKVHHVKWPSSDGPLRRRVISERFRAACGKYDIEDVVNLFPGRLFSGIYHEYFDESPNLFEDAEIKNYQVKVPKIELLLTADVRRLRVLPNIGQQSLGDLIWWRELYLRKHPPPAIF